MSTAILAAEPNGAPRLVPPLDNHRFDEARLTEYLAANLPGFEGPATVRQFQGGQSNPTFHLHTPGAEYVLRKKPPGILLPSAHAVDREYRVQSALAGSAVPVAPMRLLCQDPAVIGTMSTSWTTCPAGSSPTAPWPACPRPTAQRCTTT